MSNISIFRNHLQEIDLFMEEGTTDDGDVFFRTSQDLKNGGSVVLVILFDKGNEVIDFKVLNIAKITNALKKEEVHNLINTLNIEYRYAKFIENGGEILINYSIRVDENTLNARETLNTLIQLMHIAEDEYPKFMKLQWS